jgi:hypothetical protein
MTAIYVDTGQVLHRVFPPLESERYSTFACCGRSPRLTYSQLMLAGAVLQSLWSHRRATGTQTGGLGRRQMLALPAFHCSHGMFQSPSPSVPGRIEPTVLTIATMSPRLELL